MPTRSMPFNRKFVTIPLGGALIVMLVIWVGTGEKSRVPPERPFATNVHFSAAGKINSIQLHETSLSTSTTLETEFGTLQVRGAVSATIGEVVKLKKETTGSIERAYACVDSQISARCYDLL